MVLVAAVFGGAAAALVFWPAALSWAVAVILAVGALFFLVSAVLARSRR